MRSDAPAARSNAPTWLPGTEQSGSAAMTVRPCERVLRRRLASGAAAARFSDAGDDDDSDRESSLPAGSVSRAPLIAWALRQPRCRAGDTVSGVYVSDLRHFLDMPAEAPAPARRMAHHLSLIVRGHRRRRWRQLGERTFLQPPARPPALPRPTRPVAHRCTTVDRVAVQLLRRRGRDQWVGKVAVRPEAPEPG